MSFQNSGDSAFNSKRREGASALSGTSRKQANRRMKTLVNMPRFSRSKLTLPVFARSAHVYSRKYEMDKSRENRLSVPTRKANAGDPGNPRAPKCMVLFPLILTAEARIQ